ncbi:MAG: hypothetical protein LBB09_01710 [Rickettsiales bacterium]|nr:hypothetical protein [Rickettsiales bacterium]
MKVINFIQGVIREHLNGKIENIYITPRRNSDYPYCIIKVGAIKNLSNVRETFFLCEVCLDIYDKNADNCGLNSAGDELKNSLNGIINNQSDEFLIKNIQWKQSNLKLFNEINSIWNISLNFDVLAKQL